jgi:uncharacterized membrane protein YkvA (DUF1232 family)
MVKNLNQAEEKAEKVLSQPERVDRLLKTSRKKLSKLELEEQDFKGILGAIKTFIRMVKAYRSGLYDLPWSTIVMIVAALVYFVVPLDLIPDFIPIGGFVDDFALVIAIFKKIKDDILDFQVWEENLSSKN